MTDQREAVVERLRTAYASNDFGVLSDLLDPNVRWGGEEDTPDTCHSSTEVLAWFRGLYEKGFRATVADVKLEADLIVLGLDVVTPGGGLRRNNQAIRLAGGRIIDIRPYGD